MGTSASRSDTAVEAAWETLLWIARHYFHVSGEHHTFSPTVFVNKKHIVSEEARKEWIRRGLFTTSNLKTRASYIMTAMNKAITDTHDSDEPTPSSPNKPPKVNLTITDSSHNRKWVWNFFAIYAARRAMDYLIQDRPVRWVDDNTLLIHDRYTPPRIILRVTTDIKPSGLSDILEHEFSPREQAYNLAPDYYRVGAQMFAPPPPSDYSTSNDKPSRTSESSSSPKAQPKTAPKPSGLISLPTLLADTDIDPKEARQALRKTNTPKPAHGRWEFTPAESDSMLKLITTTIAKMRKK